MIKIFMVATILVTIIFGQDYSGYAGNYLRNGSDARSIAMGNALTAGTNTNYPAYFNPAGVAAVSSKKVSFTHQFLTLDRRQSVISFTTSLPPIGGISIGWVGTGVNNIDGRSISGVHTDYLNASENAFLLSFGIMPITKLQVGGTVKILQNQLPNLDGNITGMGVGFDFGAAYNFNDKLNFAMVLKNINAGYQWSNKLDDDLGRVYKDKFPLQLRAGTQYKVNFITLVGDVGVFFAEKTALDYDYRIGTEYIYKNFNFRVGMQNKRVALGGGFQYRQFDKFTSIIDYAIVLEPVAGLTHIISYAINF